MAQLLLLCLILSNAYLGLVQAQAMVQSSSEPLSNSPAPSPYEAKTPMNRKLGNHQPEVTKSSNVPAPGPSKGKAPQKEGKAQPSKESGLHQTPLGQMVEQNAGIHVQNVHVSKHHKSIDKSVAGGGVILGGLATTFLVAVFCYIRATGRHKNDAASSVPGSPATANATV
ncbi:hypothetical protein TorRG33x02_134160 [Trema orientale]|uniref:Transmembrane protein n=1 Tax=Trema orientale TaxID=63057 RepID=A0A2P5EZ16_TREOI|nr:hypothetical protein TorRG33x02_134160 [Trema orientale]